jgi:type II secretory pathway pseudopilin PulG
MKPLFSPDPMTKLRIAARVAQQGRTLIELVIAMAIGLVIVIGVSSLYLSSSGLSRTANQLSTTEQAGQLALLIVGESLKRAAYGEIIGSDYAAQGQTMMDGVHVAGCTGTQFTNPFPAYVAPPTPLPLPNLGCTVPSGGDSLYVRFQSRPVITQMPLADANRLSMRDCGTGLGSQAQVLSSQQMRAGTGLIRNIVTNVFVRDGVAETLNCAGYGSGGFVTLLNNVTEFKVFYRFDDVAYTAGASGMTNAVPFGGSILDASAINLKAGTIDPWTYVVAVMVCLTVKTDELSVSTVGTTTIASRCPVTAAEAEAGLNLTAATPDGALRRTFSQVFTLRNHATPSPSIL